MLTRILINALGLLVAAWLVPGIDLGAAGRHPRVEDWVTLLVVALIFGLVNAIIRPVVLFLSFPVTIVTVGLFIFVVNALMLLLTSWIAQGLELGFRVDGFVPALLGSLIVSLVSLVLGRALRPRSDRG
jgi:putative membrane protein